MYWARVGTYTWPYNSHNVSAKIFSISFFVMRYLYGLKFGISAPFNTIAWSYLLFSVSPRFLGTFFIFLRILSWKSDSLTNSLHSKKNPWPSSSKALHTVLKEAVVLDSVGSSLNTLVPSRIETFRVSSLKLALISPKLANHFLSQNLLNL